MIKYIGILFATKYVLFSLANLPSVIKSRSLSVVDNCYSKSSDFVYIKCYNIYLPEKKIDLIREVVLHNQYQYDTAQKYAVVIDLGANVGDFTAMAATNSDIVVAIEADEEIYNNLLQVVSKNKMESKVYSINKFASSTSEGHFSIAMHDVINECGIKRIDFLKIDIEGQEQDIILNNNKWLRIVNKIALEVHPALNDEICIGRMVSELREFGFDCVVCERESTQCSTDSLHNFKIGFIYARK